MEENSGDSDKDLGQNIQPGSMDSTTEQNDHLEITTNIPSEPPNQIKNGEVDGNSDFDPTSEQPNQTDKEGVDGFDSGGNAKVDGSPDINPITNTAYNDCSTATTNLQNHYDQLIHLPVATLLPSLYASEVVNTNQKEKVDAISLDTAKMAFILDVIIESLRAGVAIKYNKFLEVMKNSEDSVPKEKAKTLAPISTTAQDSTGDRCNYMLSHTVDDAVIQYYKERYRSKTIFNDGDNDDFGQTREYIDLVFILYKARKTKAHLRHLTMLRHGGNIDEAETHFSNVSKEKKLSRIFEINDKFIFIFEGTPGIGKTMVARQIASEWAKGKILGHIELLLLFYFRDPELQKVQSFRELMQHLNASSWWVRHFSEKQGKNLLLVFDGYDELSPGANMYSFFAKLLSREILPCCSIVFTSRSYSTVRLYHYCDCRIEILGFSENDRFDFLTKNKVPDEEIDKVRTFFQSNIIINSLCYIPFNMEKLLLVLDEKDLPKTQTELIKRSINKTISHHIKKSSKHKSIAGQDLEIQVKNVMDSLAPLAFEMIKNKKVVFTKTEIKNSDIEVIRDNKNGFGLIQTAQFTDVTTSADTLLYSFVHFSVQEYLAAYYLSQRFSIAQSFQIHHNFWDERYFAIWKMYTGITEVKGFALQHFLSGENYIKGGFRYLTGQEFPGVSERIMLKKVNCLLLYQMFLEAPDSKIKESVSDVVKNDTIDLSNDKLYLQDVSILTYCIARSYITMNWKWINLSNCQIGDEECSKIFQGLSLDDGRQKPAIQYLDLSYNEITFEGCFDENSSHVCLTVIHCLNISNNNITNFKALDNLLEGSNVTKLIICHNKQQITDLKMLKHTNTIKDLNLSYNNWSTVQWSLPSLPSLHKLDMSHSTFNENDLTFNMINTIPFPCLQELILSHCSLSDDASTILLNTIPKTVRILKLSHNHINDRALASLQELFKDNNQLQELYLVSTELNGASALSCAQALIGCKRLQILDISENDMSDDEAELVIRVCHKISSLKELKLKDIILTENMLRQASEFNIKSYRRPIKRKILVIGMKSTGKTTLIGKLTKWNCHDTTGNNINPFRNTACIPSTTTINQVTEVLFINGKYYECTFIDTPGLTQKIVSELYSIDEVNLILFVFKHGDTTTKALSVLSDHFKDMRCLSASVITCFGEMSNDTCESIVREFTSDPQTKQFSIDHNIGDRIYPIGFPNTARMDAIASEMKARFIHKNISKLIQLIERSSDHMQAVIDVKETTSKECSVM